MLENYTDTVSTEEKTDMVEQTFKKQIYRNKLSPTRSVEEHSWSRGNTYPSQDSDFSDDPGPEASSSSSIKLCELQSRHKQINGQSEVFSDSEPMCTDNRELATNRNGQLTCHVGRIKRGSNSGMAFQNTYYNI